MPQIEAAFAESSGIRVEVIFASSMTISRQIQQGAPYDVFLSADRDSITRLRGQLLIRPGAVVYGQGRLAIYASHGSDVVPDARLKFLGGPQRHKIRRLAIANPQTAPYGRIARQALESAGVIELLRERLVHGQNALQAARFAVSGSVDAALIPLSIATSAEFSRRGTAVTVARDLYQPLTHEAVLAVRASTDAEHFFEFLKTEPARQIFRQAGF